MQISRLTATAVCVGITALVATLTYAPSIIWDGAALFVLDAGLVALGSILVHKARPGYPVFAGALAVAALACAPFLPEFYGLIGALAVVAVALLLGVGLVVYNGSKVLERLAFERRGVIIPNLVYIRFEPYGAFAMFLFACAIPAGVYGMQHAYVASGAAAVIGVLNYTADWLMSYETPRLHWVDAAFLAAAVLGLVNAPVGGAVLAAVGIATLFNYREELACSRLKFLT